MKLHSFLFKSPMFPLKNKNCWVFCLRKLCMSSLLIITTSFTKLSTIDEGENWLTSLTCREENKISIEHSRECEQPVVERTKSYKKIVINHFSNKFLERLEPSACRFSWQNKVDVNKTEKFNSKQPVSF